MSFIHQFQISLSKATGIPVKVDQPMTDYQIAEFRKAIMKKCKELGLEKPDIFMTINENDTGVIYPKKEQKNE